jgi:hypothetical protein
VPTTTRRPDPGHTPFTGQVPFTGQATFNGNGHVTFNDAVVDDSPTVMIPPIEEATAPVPATAESPLRRLQRAMRARTGTGELIWQPQFALTSALVIGAALILVTLPLWLVLYRVSGASANNGAGPKVAELVGLTMMLLGGFVTAAATWMIIVEMRSRVRMVDALARAGEREVLLAAEALEARRHPQVNPTASLEAATGLLTSFNAVLKSFGQLPAQIAMLAVVLTLFAGATILSLH